MRPQSPEALQRAGERVTGGGWRGEDWQQAALDLALARDAAADELEAHAVVLQLRDDQRQDGHGRPVLAHQARRLTCAQTHRSKTLSLLSRTGFNNYLQVGHQGRPYRIIRQNIFYPCRSP